jgi:hypothetical protein
MISDMFEVIFVGLILVGNDATDESVLKIEKLSYNQLTSSLLLGL